MKVFARLWEAKNARLRLAIIGTAILWIGGFFLFAPRVRAEARTHVNPIRTDLFQPDGAILKKGNDQLPEIALTLDDGPYPESMEAILTALRQSGVHATFFLVGRRVVEHPELVRRIVEDGHEIGNHSFSHARLTDLPEAEVRREVDDCGQALFEAVGTRTQLFRPPGMKFDQNVRKILQEKGLVTIGWTNACKDFEIKGKPLDAVPPSELARRLLEGVGDGSILLLHSTTYTAQALPEILVSLKASGYRFVKVSEMLKNLPDPVMVTSTR